MKNLKDFKTILAKYNFRDEEGNALYGYKSFAQVVLNEENFTDELGHQLRYCAEYRELRDVFCNASSLSDEPVHEWFELSYAQYLTIPRSVLQSMATEWQRRFIKCLEELDEAIDWRPEKGTYRVRLFEIVESFSKSEQEFVSDWGRELDDPLQDYERGRRRVPLK